MGDYSFDPVAWPNPEAMMKQLTAWGMRVMVSVWPFSSPGSRTYSQFTSKDLVVNSGNSSTPVMWDDNNCNNGACVLYDPTQQEARNSAMACFGSAVLASRLTLLGVPPAALWSALDSGYCECSVRGIVLWARLTRALGDQTSTTFRSSGSTRQSPRSRHPGRLKRPTTGRGPWGHSRRA